MEEGPARQRRSGSCRSVVLRRAVGPVVGHRQGLLPYGRRPVRAGSPPGLPVRASSLGLASEARPRSVVWHLRVDHADRGVVRRLLAATQREGGSMPPGGIDRSPGRFGSELLHAMHETRCSRLRQRAFVGTYIPRAVDIVRELCRRLVDHDRRGCDQSWCSDRCRSLAPLAPPLRRRTITMWTRHVLGRRRLRLYSASRSWV